jgi:hypothetical protein
MAGRYFAGGVVIDFVVRTRPLPTAIWVNGDYWHSGEQTARDWLAKTGTINEYAGLLNPPVEFWGKDCINDDAAFYAVLKELGRP